jgi:early secretory antigenic target protein ESAT-6
MTMGFNGLLVTHAALDQAQEDIRQAVQAIDDRLHRLEGELVPLQGEWSGQAKDAYRASKAKWDSAILEMRALLSDTGATVGRANAEYLRTDNAAAAGFQQI